MTCPTDTDPKNFENVINSFSTPFINRNGDGSIAWLRCFVIICRLKGPRCRLHRKTDVNKTQTFIWLGNRVQNLRIHEKQTAN